VQLSLPALASELALQSIPISAPSGEFFGPHIVNFMFGGYQSIPSFAEFVTQFSPQPSWPRI